MPHILNGMTVEAMAASNSYFLRVDINQVYLKESEGVVAFIDAKSIKSQNKFVHAGGFDSIEDEEVYSYLFLCVLLITNSI